MAARQTKVSQFDDIVYTQQQVLWLDVAMHDIAGGGGSDTGGGLFRQVHSTNDGKLPPGQDGMLESVTVYVVHHNEQAAFVFAEIHRTDDMRPREASQQLELTLKPFDQFALCGGLAA